MLEYSLQFCQRLTVPLLHFFQKPFLFKTISIFKRQKICLSFSKLCCIEYCLNAVVITCGNWIKFMIMTLRALQRMRKKCLTNTIGDIIEKSLTGNPRNFHTRQFPRPLPKKTNSNKMLWVFWRNLITSYLLSHESVIRFVVLKGSDDIITISPCIPAFKIICKPRGIGIANDIQPVLCHTLTIMWRSKQPLHNILKCLFVLTRIIEEAVHFIWCRRQTGEIKGCSTD